MPEPRGGRSTHQAEQSFWNAFGLAYIILDIPYLNRLNLRCERIIQNVPIQDVLEGLSPCATELRGKPLQHHNVAKGVAANSDMRSIFHLCSTTKVSL